MNEYSRICVFFVSILFFFESRSFFSPFSCTVLENTAVIRIRTRGGRFWFPSCTCHYDRQQTPAAVATPYTTVYGCIVMHMYALPYSCKSDAR
jgi:hypothetical protein